ncbi:YaiI/YqxD family protein [Psychrobium sp. MM17-31]|uniref:YaiI/YqxD family protein n=1 Tax=Psychrobium sp. MM17-31 TaxID=2917758 RepID=UPI001EF736E7|nr:YaiI/YqxD family protein [Psychrobium sp. MM17-31]MCG7532960.1 YaiI/YqxD family protein [Psychrobium sp. MM17-31]
MNIWVDADACPVVIKEILYRAAHRAQIPMTLVANHALSTPPSPYIKTQTVVSGFDVADDEIVKKVEANDLVITSDIPLADEVITKGAKALSPRGELFTKSNIKARLNIRDFMDTMRASGVQTGGQAPLSQADRQNFANHLDTIICKAQASIRKAQSSKGNS